MGGASGVALGDDMRANIETVIQKSMQRMEDLQYVSRPVCKPI